MKLVSKVLFSLAAGLALASGAFAADKLEEGKDYQTLLQPATEKPSVMQFISFTCGHCNQFHNVYHVPQGIEEMIKKHPGATFEEYHINFGNQKTYEDFARLRAVLKVSKNDQLMGDAYSLVYGYRNDDSLLKTFVEKNTGKTAQEVDQLWNSFLTKTFDTKQIKLTQQYQITETPTFIVNGKYKAIFSNLKFERKPGEDEGTAIGRAVVNHIERLMTELPLQ